MGTLQRARRVAGKHKNSSSYESSLQFRSVKFVATQARQLRHGVVVHLLETGRCSPRLCQRGPRRSRTRHLMRRKGMAPIVGAVGSVVIVAALCGTGPWSAYRMGGNRLLHRVGVWPASRTETRRQGWNIGSPLHGVTPESPSEMGIVAPGVGWVANGVGLYLTRNDGTSWSRLRAPGLGGDVVAHLTGVAMIGVDNLYVAYWTKGYGPCGYSGVPGATRRAHLVNYIAVSHDGGDVWHLAHLPTCARVEALSVPSARQGFALVRTGTAVGLLFSTRNGGISWSRVSATPFVGTIQFANAETGWGVESDVALGRSGLFYTSSGGLTWKRSTICRYGRAGGVHVLCGGPKFFGVEHGVIPAVRFRSGTGIGSLLVYDTKNGGRKWAGHVVLGRQETTAVPTLKRYLVRFSAASTSMWFIVVGSEFWITSDSGATWSKFRSRPIMSSGNVVSMEMVGQLSGWLLFRAKSGQTVLETTGDGGRVWKALGSTEVGNTVGSVRPSAA